MTQQRSTPYSRLRPKIRKPYTQIYLIRHCEPDYSLKKKLGDDNMPLSEIGRGQRTYLNKKLKSLDLERLYSSELTRARETAEVFAKNADLKVTIEPELNELDWVEWYRVRYFCMSDLRRKRSVKNYAKMNYDLNSLQDKTNSLISKVWESNKGKNVALFCHGNMIRTMLTGILNTDVIGFLSMEIFQSSVSKLVIDRQGYIKINYINNIGHLPRHTNEDLFRSALN